MTYLVLYHKNCEDGLAAALAVREWLFNTGQMKGAKFQTAQYGDHAAGFTIERPKIL